MADTANPSAASSPESNPGPQTSPDENLNQPEAAGTSPAESAHEQPDQHVKDLAEFNKDLLYGQKNNKALVEEFEKLDASNPDNITRLRRGGVDQSTDKQDTLKKHSRLAAAFLEKAKEGDKTSYMVDFKDNAAADSYIGAGDILPANVEAIKVLDDNGNVVSNRAVRNINSRNRIGYYDTRSGQYIGIHTGYRIIVLSTRTDTSRRLTEENKESFRADPLLARRKMKEHVSLYQAPSNTDPEDLHVGLDNSPPASATAEEIQKHELPPPAGPSEPARKESVSTPELQNMGYQRLAKVTPEVTREAVRCLKKGGPIDTTHFVEIDGKKYAFHREIHRHNASECPPLPAHLCQDHHGISVFSA